MSLGNVRRLPALPPRLVMSKDHSEARRYPALRARLAADEATRPPAFASVAVPTGDPLELRGPSWTPRPVSSRELPLFIQARAKAKGLELE